MLAISQQDSEVRNAEFKKQLLEKAVQRHVNEAAVKSAVPLALYDKCDQLLASVRELLFSRNVVQFCLSTIEKVLGIDRMSRRVADILLDLAIDHKIIVYPVDKSDLTRGYCFTKLSRQIYIPAH